jgi:hypothetical protein
MIIVAEPSNTRFKTGRAHITPGVMKAIRDLKLSNREIGIALSKLLQRHGDQEQGELCEHDFALNLEAAKQGLPVYSSFSFMEKIFWVVTDADRHTTTVLLPEEH